ncbi:anaerobic sulfatase maturase [Alteromonas sp. C1M14]|uniref:anaerobic sulfatase maturase n=1 Tax=Alteromonas sp. C1M14 TaxID=2841567 RepID=UPI001C08ECFA|nr:anaerobic sulfatase maturase [Alteromonas sp. C1M14]MBU2977761.1 anaerobic sulfatase maturase [Alteromonas sp. C1M14]
MNYPFHLIIKPVGDQCNLNCSYCFYKEKSEEGTVMTFATLEKLTQQYIEEQPGSCKEVQFVWQGGEPMLAGLSFYQHAMVLQEKYRRPGMAITNAIQTNGTLITNRWIEFLKQYDFQVGISIDGMAGVHDAERIYYTGKSSHHKVIEAYRKLQKAAITTNILCVVHQNNVGMGKQIYQYFVNDLKAKNIQFLPVVGQATIAPALWGEFLVQSFGAWCDDGVGRVSVQLFDASYARIIQGIETFCVHSHECGQQLAAERNGDIFSCDQYVEKQHHIGNVTSESFNTMLAKPVHNEFVSMSTRHDIACQSCEIKGLCQGGCPKHRDQHGKNKLCEGYYRFFTHAIPYFYAFGECVRRNMPVYQYRRFLPEITMKIA